MFSAFQKLVPAEPLCRWTLVAWAIAGVGTLQSAGRCPAETWTSLDGSRSIQAEMVGLWNDLVILKLDSGRTVHVPMASLIAVSRIQAEDIAQRLDREREQVTAEYRRTAELESAAAPDPLPTPPPAIDYEPLPPNLAPADAIDKIRRQLEGGHVAILIDALPPKHRTRLQSWVDLVAKKVDPAAWDAQTGVLHRAAGLVVTRQNWILSHPRLSPPGRDGVSPEVDSLVRQGLIPLCAALSQATTSEELTHQAITKGQFLTWLRDRDRAIAPYLADLTRQWTQPTAGWELGAVEKDEDGIETVQAVAAGGANDGESGPARSVTLKKIDGYWLPARLADGMDEWIDNQTQQWQSIPDGSASVEQTWQLIAGGGAAELLFALETIEPVLPMLESAESPAAFHQAAEPVLAAAGQIVRLMRDWLPEPADTSASPSF